jgi:hypothetical protein
LQQLEHSGGWGLELLGSEQGEPSATQSSGVGATAVVGEVTYCAVTIFPESVGVCSEQPRVKSKAIPIAMPKTPVHVLILIFISFASVSAGQSPAAIALMPLVGRVIFRRGNEVFSARPLQLS